MAVSLEVRSPFLDYRLVEYLASLPTALKFRDGRGKWLLRRLLAGQVPAAVLTRPKHGFARDGSYWARIEFRARVGLTMAQWSCPDWAQLLADIDHKRVEYHCPLFPIEEPTTVHW